MTSKLAPTKCPGCGGPATRVEIIYDPPLDENGQRPIDVIWETYPKAWFERCDSGCKPYHLRRFDGTLIVLEVYCPDDASALAWASRYADNYFYLRDTRHNPESRFGFKICRVKEVLGDTIKESELYEAYRGDVVCIVKPSSGRWFLILRNEIWSLRRLIVDFFERTRFPIARCYHCSRWAFRLHLRRFYGCNWCIRCTEEMGASLENSSL